MKHILFTFYVCLSATIGIAQDYTPSSIFAHNDYAQPSPFVAAYALGVGYIEADIFLSKNGLIVAHTRLEAGKGRKLEDLYLKPLEEKIKANNGSAYEDQNKSLVLMIDLKTEGPSTLKKLVDELKSYPYILSCKALKICISGNVPDPATWSEYPEYITFDGRPGINYTSEQLERITLISTNFNNYSSWNGKGTIHSSDRDKILKLRDEVHAKGKKLRFWGSPDVENGWLTLMDLQIDVIGSDNIAGLFKLIQSRVSDKDRKK